MEDGDEKWKGLNGRTMDELIFLPFAYANSSPAVSL